MKASQRLSFQSGQAQVKDVLWAFPMSFEGLHFHQNPRWYFWLWKPNCSQPQCRDTSDGCKLGSQQVGCESFSIETVCGFNGTDLDVAASGGFCYCCMLQKQWEREDEQDSQHSGQELSPPSQSTNYLSLSMTSITRTASVPPVHTFTLCSFELYESWGRCIMSILTSGGYSMAL
jgi:hypothetical protein